MIVTADPSELRNLARQCREQARALDDAIGALQRSLDRTREKWTGKAANSLSEVVAEKIGVTRNAVRLLESAANELEQGARDVQAARDADAKAEREKREREQREKQTQKR